VAVSRGLIPKLTRYRRMSGGAMRQVGIFAAAALWALDHNVERIAEDHANARSMAERLAASPAYIVDPAAPATNILAWDVAPSAPDASTIVGRARDRGVLVVALGTRTIRAVTHLDVNAEQCEAAAAILVEVAAS
jgi:threonine aldolase